MPRFKIYCDRAAQHIVEADDEFDAIQVWLDDVGGYDSIEHAAAENFCDPEDIYAQRLD